MASSQTSSTLSQSLKKQSDSGIDKSGAFFENAPLLFFENIRNIAFQAHAAPDQTRQEKYA